MSLFKRWPAYAACWAVAVVLAFAVQRVARSPSAFAATPDAQTNAGSQPDGFAAENGRAMDKMMRDMDVKPTGDIDRDFVAMMVPHHQGAIDMAQAMLRHGKNEQLRRLAQEIIVTQQQEIAAMKLAIGESLPSPAPSPTTAAAPATRPVTPRAPSVHRLHQSVRANSSR